MKSTHLKIKSVDIQKEEIRQDLKRLHSEFFRLDELIEFDSGYWWMAYDGTKPIGFCGVAPSTSWRNTGYMCRAGVKWDYRGLGLHNRLIRVRTRFAKKQGWSHLVTDTTNNCPSANNLIANGFKMYKPSKPWGLPSACYWIKKLNKI
ncbi:GNAT family N-acetyltransferase [Polynucleobacter paneuropaeus]|uniref:GNAT family N-acetyltransferase n=1 Tax=Polynucleobacter paneuropaeus TaxID=2527775 RepID=UPI001BFE1636|nr:GNAT family N-acetyltransferase [Polynucleobacter paneuropaeus]